MLWPLFCVERAALLSGAMAASRRPAAAPAAATLVLRAATKKGQMESSVAELPALGVMGGGFALSAVSELTVSMFLVGISEDKDII